MLTRYVLVHWHIYKNAGSSVERLMWESFGDAFAVLETQAGYDTISNDTLRAFLTHNSHIKAVSSHHLHPPLAIKGALPIVLLRHPADRARSAYRYAKQTEAVPDHAIAASHDFRGYVDWSLNTRGEGAVLHDHQVQHLSHAAWRAQDPDHWRATRADLGQAQDLLQHLPAFGLVRRFAESCRLFNAAYRPCSPAMHFHDRAENTTGVTRQTEAEALADIRDELGELTYQALCAGNALDLALYETASVLFDARLKRLRRLSSRLSLPGRLLAGRVRRRLFEPAGGIGSSMHPEVPACIRLPADMAGR